MQSIISKPYEIEDRINEGKYKNIRNVQSHIIRYKRVAPSKLILKEKGKHSWGYRNMEQINHKKQLKNNVTQESEIQTMWKDSIFMDNLIENKIFENNNVATRFMEKHEKDIEECVDIVTKLLSRK